MLYSLKDRGQTDRTSTHVCARKHIHNAYTLSTKLISSLTVIRFPFLKWFIHSFCFPPLFLFIVYPSPQLPPCSVTGSLPRLFAESALCPPPGSPIIVLRADIGHRQWGTCSKRQLERGAAIRKMGNCPTVSQRTAAGYLFILLFARRQCSRLWRRNSIFILSLTVLPLRSTLHPPFCKKNPILCFYPSVNPLMFSVSLSSSFSPLCESHRHDAHKRFSAILLASGVVVWVNIVWVFFGF